MENSFYKRKLINNFIGGLYLSFASSQSLKENFLKHTDAKWSLQYRVLFEYCSIEPTIKNIACDPHEIAGNMINCFQHNTSFLLLEIGAKKQNSI